MGSVAARARGPAIRRGAALALVAAGAAAVAVALQPTTLHGATNARRASSPRQVEARTRRRRVGYWPLSAVSIPVHKRASTASPVVTKLHSSTEDGYSEVYLVLAKKVMRDGRTWVKIALPMRPNGETGWVVKGALGKIHRVAMWLVIDRS